LRQVLTLFKKDLLLEVRQQYSFYGILLYISATIFVLFNAVNEPEAKVWNGLFWVIQLFICINAVAKSFLQESKGRMLYFYSISSPVHFVISKLLFNSLLMLLMSIHCFLVIHWKKRCLLSGWSYSADGASVLFLVFWQRSLQGHNRMLRSWLCSAFRLSFHN